MTMRNAFAVLCGVLLTGLVACKDPLDVQNQNQSDVDRTLATPADLETFIGTTYIIAHQATLGGSNDGLQTQMQTMGFENVSGLANFAMGPRGAIPRPPITNTPNATGDAGNQFDFYRGHRAARRPSARWRVTGAPGPSRTSAWVWRWATSPWRTTPPLS